MLSVSFIFFLASIINLSNKELELGKFCSLFPVSIFTDSKSFTSILSTNSMLSVKFISSSLLVTSLTSVFTVVVLFTLTSSVLDIFDNKESNKDGLSLFVCPVTELVFEVVVPSFISRLSIIFDI